MDEIDKLIKDLESPDANVREHAAYALGKIKYTRAVPELIQALKDENASVRRYVAYALAEIKDTRAVPELIQALKDENASVRSYAASALGEIIKEQNSIEKLDEIRKCLLEFTKLDRDSSIYTDTRKLVSNLLIQINARKNQLVALDIQLDPRIKPPKKPEGGTYRMPRALAVR